MLPKETLSAFISALDSRIPPPVHTAGVENTRPVPAVVIQNMTVDEQRYHNSHFAGSNYANDGSVSKEIYRHYYDLRLQLLTRDDDETDAFDYFGQLKLALSELSRDPSTTIHEHVNTLDTGGSGEVSYQFYEPTETEINQAVTLKTFFDSEKTDFDTIDAIDTTYDFN